MYLTLGGMLISSSLLPPNPSLVLTPDALVERPHCAVFFGPIIATWGDIEARLDSLFLLLAGDETALAEFQQLRGWDARTKQYIKETDERHGSEFKVEVRAILNAVADPAKKRHELAHGVWGTCKELPQDLVLFPSEVYTSAARDMLRAEQAGSPRINLSREFLDRGRVVGIYQLQALLNELQAARTILHTFWIERSPDVVHVHSRETLPRAADHPEVAPRISMAKKHLRRETQRKQPRAQIS